MAARSPLAVDLPDQADPAGRHGEPIRARIAPLCDAVLAHRTDYWTWVDLHSTEPNRSELLRLRDHWREINTRYFDGAMTEPYITLTEPSIPRAFGQCCPVSSWGSRLEIRIRPSLPAGTHPLLASGEHHRPGRIRFVADVLTHEAIHQWQMEITGFTASSYHGHGPTFRAKANQIGADLHPTPGGGPQPGRIPRRRVRAVAAQRPPQRLLPRRLRATSREDTRA